MFKLFVIFLIFIVNSLQSKTIILGFDGMDPVLAQQWMDSGDLPNFKKLAESGHFQSLATTNPAQSPVAWSSFATGLNPGEHGIFDFIHRDPQSFDPVYSISGFKQPETMDVFGWDVPTSDAKIYNKRLGKPFWLTAEQKGNHSSVLRVPVTYPPDNITSMLSGMGVPDLLGTQGTYTYYATKYIDKGQKGGNIVRVKVKNNQINTTLQGPPNPMGGELLSMPLILNNAENKTVNFKLDSLEFALKEGEWSQWLPVDFSYAGVFSLGGIVRVHLVESFPRVKFYVSPININPESPLLPISNPPEFSAQLAEEIGLYHTLGMPEETWSLNDGLIDGETFLEMIKKVLAEREAMFFKQLSDDSLELLIEVFVQTDRVSHMFWRGLDPLHAGYEKTNEVERNAIKWIYTEADRILGKTMDQLKPDDKLIVLSDHGFAPYYKHVNLNRWLFENGYLNLLSTADEDKFSLKDVDWSQTKAYAMGLNGIYLNVKNREKSGIVEENQIAQISDDLKNKIMQFSDADTQVINKIYTRDEAYQGDESKNSPDLVVGYKRGYRASWQTVLGEAPKELFSINTDNWSGDHCIDPTLVPGVLFTNFKHNDIQTVVNGIQDVAGLALSTLTNNDPIDLDQSSALLDFPTKLLTSIFLPIKNYIPSSIGLVLIGLLMALWLKGMGIVANKTPKRFGIRTIVKITLMGLSVILFVNTTRNLFSDNYITAGDDIIVEAHAIDVVELPPLTWTTNNKDIDLAPSNKNQWQFNMESIVSDSISLKESDGYTLVEVENNPGNYGKVQKQWWHTIVSNPGGYIDQHSQVDRVTVNSVLNKTIWWIWLTLGLIGVIFINRLLLKKHNK